jgi:hypothetical protein
LLGTKVYSDYSHAGGASSYGIVDHGHEYIDNGHLGHGDNSHANNENLHIVDHYDFGANIGAVKSTHLTANGGLGVQK